MLKGDLVPIKDPFVGDAMTFPKPESKAEAVQMWVQMCILDRFVLPHSQRISVTSAGSIATDGFQPKTSLKARCKCAWS
jgi:hypothetical protein